jgi:hypothetical protein
MRLWTGFIWLRIETSAGVLVNHGTEPGFHEGQEIS